MKLIVGLGNPGAKYKMNRHNIGFLLIDQYIGHNTDQSFSIEKKFFGEIIKLNSKDSEGIIYLKPMTFMNLSGQAVKAVIHFFKIKPEDILVIQDEIDLSTGTIKFKEGGGHAGHNGLRSIIKQLGTNIFKRIRIGVGRPSHPDFPVSDYVLANFKQEELDLIQDQYLKIETIINNFAKGQLETE